MAYNTGENGGYCLPIPPPGLPPRPERRGLLYSKPFFFLEPDRPIATIGACPPQDQGPAASAGWNLGRGLRSTAQTVGGSTAQTANSRKLRKGSRMLVSGLYRLAPSDGYVSRDEAELRLKSKVRRLVEQYGQAEVLRRIRSYPVPAEQENLKAWIVLTVYATEHRRASTGVTGGP